MHALPPLDPHEKRAVLFVLVLFAAGVCMAILLTH